MVSVRAATLVVIGALGAWSCASRGSTPKHSGTDNDDTDETTAASHPDNRGNPSESPTSIIDDTDTSSASGAKAPLDFVPLRGPLDSLDAYRKERGAEWDSSCGAPPRRQKASPLRAGGRGRIRSVELLRIPSHVSCAPVEYCALAFRTDEGWFVREEDSPCTGSSGSSGSVQTKDQRLVWVDIGESHVLEYRYSVLATQKSERTEQQGENPLQGPTTHESENFDETKWLVLCGAGASGKPSCTARLLTSCAAADGQVNTVSWKYQDTTLMIDSAADPSHACQGDLSFVLGSYVLEIP